MFYIDCHSGRGRHKTGHIGSPILALQLLIEHKLRDKILSNTDVHFIFFEINEINYKILCDEINALGQLSKKIYIHPILGDYEYKLRKAIIDIKSKGRQFAPSFAFLDPYGFSLSMNLFNEFLSFPTCELLINFMYRYIDMAIFQDSQAENMDRLFGCPDWRQLSNIKDYIERSEQTILLFSNQLKSNYLTKMYMRASNGALKYVLFHATNHKRGREVMKQAMWCVTPDGSFTAYERESPDQAVLIQPNPNLEPLKKALWNRFAGQKVVMNDIYDWLLNQTYLEKHIHEVLRYYRDKNIITFSRYEGRFAFDKNPVVTFPSKRPTTEN